MKFRISFLFSLISGLIYSQSFSTHSLALSPKLFPDVNFDESAYIKKLQTRFQSQSNQNLVNRYIEDEVRHKKYLLNSNQVYGNWEEATTYVRKVFEKAIPGNYTKEEVNISIIRDPDVNAYCFEDGNIAVTVGFLAWFETEAILASTLSHEYGHYYENHLFLDYKKTNKNAIIGAFTGYTGALISASNLYKFKRDQEREADKYACDFFLLNAYDPANISLEFRQFKQIGIKYEHLKEYRRPWLYFSSHPADDERIAYAENYFKGKPTGGKNFLVDSLQFYAIKKRAIDETLYLLFEELRYDECLEIAYLQHLYQPKDEFYLYFIVECLRRELIFSEPLANELFITWNYNKLEPDSASIAQLPVYVKREDFTEVSPARFKNSVFTNLKGFIYNLTPEEYGAIQAKNLLPGGDTLEFLTNKGALAYFIQQLNAGQAIFEYEKKLLTKHKEPIAETANNRSELEAEVYSNLNSYFKIRNKEVELKKAPLLYYRTYINTDKGSRVVVVDVPEVERQVNKTYEDVKQSYSDSVLDLRNRFSFRQHNAMLNTTNFIEQIAEPKNGKEKRSHEIVRDFDYLEFFPEFSNEVAKYHYKKVIFLKVEIGNPIDKTSRFGNKDERMETWVASIYCVDFANGTISKRVKGFNYFGETGSRYEKFNSILSTCQEMANQ